MIRPIILRFFVSQWVIFLCYSCVLFITQHPSYSVLHPRHKLQYFKNVGWEQEWIDTAKEIVCDEFNRSYYNIEVEDEDDKAFMVCFLFNFAYLNIQVAIQAKFTESKNIFDNIPALLAPKASDLRSELEQYLSMDPEDVTDALLWWYEQKHIYPCLHHMALNYLSIPHEFESQVNIP